MYGEFSGAYSVKCLEMVAYHTIHWSCDSVIIVSCMHVITNCVTCLLFMLCMDYESEIKIYYNYYYYMLCNSMCIQSSGLGMHT